MKGDAPIAHVRKVVILDEAQLVPVEFLELILAIMILLVEDYKVSFVICTAMQFGLTGRPESDRTTLKPLQNNTSVLSNCKPTFRYIGVQGIIV